MNMKISELINEIITEWSYRCDDGMPNPKNPTHLKELGIVLSEMGLSHIKPALIENLLMEKGKTPEKNVVEADGNFTNPALNKSIKYKDDKGEDKEGIVGNLLRLPKESPGRVAAEKTLPADGTPERDAINKDLGGQNQPAGAEKPKADGGEEDGAPKEDPAKAAQAMFDPKADPAMAARMDKEKEVQAQLAKDAEEDKEAEKVQEPKEDGEFNPIDSKDVAKEMPEADPETFAGGSDIPDGVEPEQLEQFNTDIKKVAQQVADAKAKGEPAPNINLCDVTVPGTNLYCDDNLGIPRDEMPQFKGNASPGSRAASMDADASGEVDTEPVFREMLQQKGIKTLQTEIPADKLKATQKDLVGAKVVGMMGALEKDPNHPKITAPIYVSRDGYVIDGHHRWAAVVAYNAANPDKQIQMKTTVLDQDIKDAIPMANKFAEDMGIAAKKADANKEDPQKVTSAPKVTEKIKKKIENWSKEEKAFFEKNEGAPGSEMRRSLGQALKDKAAGAWKAIKSGAKHEVHIFKDAGKGVSNFFKGEKLSEEETKALKSVGVKIATTALFAAGMGGLSAGVAGFSKLVAIELIPHVVAETIVLGAGRAAIFADMEGEAETDANMQKFAELIAKGLEEMEITPEMMEQMVDSYNEKKESGEMDNVETPIEPKVKAEHLHLVDELMLEMIYGFIEEIKSERKAGESKTYPGYFHRGGGYYSKQTNGEISHKTVGGSMKALSPKEKAEKNKTTKPATKPVDATIDPSGFRKTGEKNLEPNTQNTPQKIEDTENQIDRKNFSKKNPKTQKDAPNGPTQQEILDDLNGGNLNKITEYQNDVENSRAKGVAGAGGAVASEGESKYCNACNLDKKQWRADNQQELTSIKEGLRSKKRNKEEKLVAASLGYDEGDEAFLDTLAEAELYCKQKTAEVEADKDSVLYKKGKEGFADAKVGNKTDAKGAYCEWMKAGYFGSIATKRRLDESKLDTTQPHKIVQSTTELNDAVQAHLEDMVEKSQGDDKKYYKHQLKLFKKFKMYHDTFAIGKDKNGRTAIVSISNKKDSEVKDPQNNTTPAQRLRLMQIKFGDDVASGVSNVIDEGIQKVSNAAAATVKSQAKMKIDDLVVAACESPKMKNYMDVLNGIATDGKHRFSKYIESKGKDWENLSTKEKLELMNEYSNSRLYDEKGNPRIIEKDEGTFYKDDTGKEVGPIKNLGQIGLPYEPFGKIAIKLGEFRVNEETSAIKQAEKDIVTAVHTEVTNQLFKDDEPDGYHPDTNPNADNGKHTQAYISGVMDAMHLGTYIDLDDDDDDAMLIQMGVNGVKPSMIRNCIAEKSGYTGDFSTPKGKAALKEHILKKSRVTPGGEKVSVMNEGKEVELFNDQWRTAGTTQKVASYFGKDMRECLQEKAKFNS
jgi:hypothetical protein